MRRSSGKVRSVEHGEGACLSFTSTCLFTKPSGLIKREDRSYWEGMRVGGQTVGRIVGGQRERQICLVNTHNDLTVAVTSITRLVGERWGRFNHSFRLRVEVIFVMQGEIIWLYDSNKPVRIGKGSRNQGWLIMQVCARACARVLSQLQSESIR